MNRRVIDYKLLESESARGLTVNRLMSVLGVSPGTWYKRMNDDPEFKAAYDRGRERNNGDEPSWDDLIANADEVDEMIAAADRKPPIVIVEDDEDDETYDAEPEPSMREYILQAVSLGLHLPRQIAKDLSVPIYEVVRDADAMVEAGDLAKLEAVTFSGYYLPGTIPAGRPFLNGNGEIGFAIEAAASNGNGLSDDQMDDLMRDLEEHVAKLAPDEMADLICDLEEHVAAIDGNRTIVDDYPVVTETVKAPSNEQTTRHKNCWSSRATVTSVIVPLSDGSITIEADIDLFSATRAEAELFAKICQAVRDFKALDAAE